MPHFVVFIFETKDDETKFLESYRNAPKNKQGECELYTISSSKLNKYIFIHKGPQFKLSWDARGSDMFQLFEELCQQNPKLTRDQVETTVHLGYIRPEKKLEEHVAGCSFDYLNRIDRIYEFHNWADRHPGFAGQKETPNKLQLVTRNRLLQRKVDKLEFELEEHKDHIVKLEKHINKLERGQSVVSLY